jgi:hypothetical protein
MPFQNLYFCFKVHFFMLVSSSYKDFLCLYMLKNRFLRGIFMSLMSDLRFTKDYGWPKYDSLPAENTNPASTGSSSSSSFPNPSSFQPNLQDPSATKNSSQVPKETEKLPCRLRTLNACNWVLYVACVTTHVGVPVIALLELLGLLPPHITTIIHDIAVGMIVVNTVGFLPWLLCVLPLQRCCDRGKSREIYFNDFLKEVANLDKNMIRNWLYCFNGIALSAALDFILSPAADNPDVPKSLAVSIAFFAVFFGAIINFKCEMMARALDDNLEERNVRPSTSAIIHTFYFLTTTLFVGTMLFTDRDDPLPAIVSDITCCIFFFLKEWSERINTSNDGKIRDHNGDNQI